jgi:hypothetical protein
MKVPIKKYVMDETLSWEERYKQLEAHHKEETEWLIEKIEQLEEAVDNPAPPCPEGGYCDSDEDAPASPCRICGLEADHAWDLAITGPYGY